MTKDVGILILGLLVAAMPFLGFPSSIETGFFLVAGLLVAVLGFLVRSESQSTQEPHRTDTYEQNGNYPTETGDMTDYEATETQD